MVASSERRTTAMPEAPLLRTLRRLVVALRAAAP